MKTSQPSIQSLALLSDRNTCAVTDRAGCIQWYCPERFDGMAVMSSLIDDSTGGSWSLAMGEAIMESRNYLDFSSILEQHFKPSNHAPSFTIRDWMPLDQSSSGIVREFICPSVSISSVLRLRGNYGRESGLADQLTGRQVVFCNTGLVLACSHPVYLVDDDTVRFTIPAGESGWAFLITGGDREHTHDTIASLRKGTQEEWKKVETQFEYEGPYQREIQASIRAIQQLTCGKTGGVLAAATSSLPEVVGGKRNYDYRYVWVRDAALNTMGLSMLAGNERTDVKFLDFMHQAMERNTERCVYPLYTIDQQIISHLTKLGVSGYHASYPATVGNVAYKQRQLDAEANILLSAKVLYDKYKERIHWQTMRRVANYICVHWEEPDNGIWEEGTERQYTAGKVLAALALEQMALYNEEEEEAARWRKNAGLIRNYVASHCMTAKGAFADYAGSDQVDISSVLFAVLGYTSPQSPEMCATIAALEERHGTNGLYRRTLTEFDANKEGVFLAGCCWMAHYYITAGELEKAKDILDKLVCCQNDLGFFSEEADVHSGEMLGNFAQTFVHSSFIGAVHALSQATD